MWKKKPISTLRLNRTSLNETKTKKKKLVLLFDKPLLLITPIVVKLWNTRIWLDKTVKKWKLREQRLICVARKKKWIGWKLDFYFQMKFVEIGVNVNVAVLRWYSNLGVFDRNWTSICRISPLKCVFVSRSIWYAFDCSRYTIYI